MEELNLYDEETAVCGVKSCSASVKALEDTPRSKPGHESVIASAFSHHVACSRPPIIEIDRDTYCEVASAFIDAVGDGYYYNGSIDGDGDGFYYTLTATVIVYREDSYASDGRSDCIRDIVPVWWEFATVMPMIGEVLNDFSFRELKEAVIASL